MVISSSYHLVNLITNYLGINSIWGAVYIIVFALKVFHILSGSIHLNKVLNHTELGINEFLSLELINYHKASLPHCLMWR